MKVSIVIPTFRRPDLLSRLLKSIHAQSYRHYEVIVVDDGSPNREEYAEVVRESSALFPEFSFLSNESNCGAPYSRNRGIRQAAYELIALVDDDDEWLPEKLDRQVETFAQAPEQVGIVYTWTDVVENGVRKPFYRSIIEGPCLRQILHECFIPSPSVMVRKQALFDAGLFDERFPSCQDWDTWTSILAKGYEARVVPEVLTLYHRKTAGSIGMSPRARIGYKMYYRKHLPDLIRLGQFRGLIRFARSTIGL